MANETQQWLSTVSTQFGKEQVSNLKLFEDSTVRTIRNNPSSFRREIENFNEALETDAYSRLGEDVKTIHRLEFRNKAARAYLDGLEEQAGPGAALKALKELKEELDPDQLRS